MGSALSWVSVSPSVKWDNINTLPSPWKGSRAVLKRGGTAVTASPAWRQGRARPLLSTLRPGSIHTCAPSQATKAGSAPGSSDLDPGGAVLLVTRSLLRWPSLQQSRCRLPLAQCRRALRCVDVRPLLVCYFQRGLLEGKTSFKILRNKTPGVGFRGRPVRRYFWRDALFPRPSGPGLSSGAHSVTCSVSLRPHRQGAPQGPCG